MYRAVIDTMVLASSRRRDFLLELATQGGYATIWSSGTLGELESVLAKIDHKRGMPPRPEFRARLLWQMRSSFPGSEIEAPRGRAYHYDLLDPYDGHVAHAAVIGKADAIVTEDTKAGFKTSTDLASAFVDIVAAGEFAANTVSAHPQAGVLAVQALAKRRRRPAMTPVKVLDDLATLTEMREVAEMLRDLV